MKVIKIRMPEKLYVKSTLGVLKSFLEDLQNKPCLSLMLSKMKDGIESEDMKPSFITLLDDFLLNSSDPGIQRLRGEYSVEFCDEEKDMALIVRRDEKEIVITIGANYYEVNESEE